MADGSTRGIAEAKTAKKAKVGLLPPPSSIDQALERIASRKRREAVREGLYRSRWTLLIFWKLSAVGKAGALSALAFCSDADSVENLINEEAVRDLDPKRAAQCERVARERGLGEYDHTNPVHRARVSCSWQRRQHCARAGAVVDQTRIEADDHEAEREEREAERQSEASE